MTLEQLKRWARTQAIFDDVTEREQKEAIAAIERFTQPAQGVDLAVVQRVADELSNMAVCAPMSAFTRMRITEQADKLTAAIAHTKDTL